MTTDIWSATGRSALDADAPREFDGSTLFWRVEDFDRGLPMESLDAAADHHIDHAETTLHHWLELIRSQQRKRKEGAQRKVAPE